MSAKLYVLTTERPNHLNAKIACLHQAGYKPELFTDVDVLVKTFKHTRVSIVVVDDGRGRVSVLDDIKKLTGEPEFSGVRFILSVFSVEPELAVRAVQYYFRDLVALDLPDNLWLERFQFASSGTKIDVRMPACQLVYPDLAAIRVPGRITMLNDSRLWLETPVNIKQGEVLAIAGPLPDALGLKSLNLIVDDKYREDLYYRFSQGLMCSMALGAGLDAQKAELLARLRQTVHRPSLKGYIGIKNRELRGEVIALLRGMDITVFPALNMSSLVKEPVIVSPDIIVVDDQIMLSPGFKAAFGATMRQLPAGARLFVIARPESLQMVNALGLGNAATVVTSPAQIPLKGVVEMQQKAAIERYGRDRIYIHRNHPLSHINVIISARLMQIHPLCASLALPIPLHKFSLAMVDVPFLKKAVGAPFAAKIIQCQECPDPENPEFRFRIDCTLSGLNRFQREAIGSRMLEMIDSRIPHGPLSLQQILQSET